MDNFILSKLHQYSQNVGSNIGWNNRTSMTTLLRSEVQKIQLLEQMLRKMYRKKNHETFLYKMCIGFFFCARLTD